MEAINLIISRQQEGDKVSEILEGIYSDIIQCEHQDLIKEPFNMIRLISDGVVITRKQHENHVIIVNERYLVKYDYSPENTFIINLFAKACGLNVPNLVIVKASQLDKLNLQSIEHDEEEIEFKQDDYFVVIEYMINWKDYHNRRKRNESFITQLADILAFDLTIYNFDRFSFVMVYADLIIEGESIEQAFNTLKSRIKSFNEGNLGFYEDKLWAIDHSTDLWSRDKKNPMDEIRNLMKSDKFVDNVCQLVFDYFKIKGLDREIFKKQLVSRYTINQYIIPYYKKLIVIK